MPITTLPSPQLLPNMEAYRNSLARTIGVNLLYGLVSVNVDNFGHIGGLVGGALVAFLLGPHLRRASRGRGATGLLRMHLTAEPASSSLAQAGVQERRESAGG